MNNQNLNSLVSRMLANAKENKQQETTSTTATSSIKRNLFGIRLNHDQLKQDLKEMWQEQLERKKREWNFDFETLKPLSQEIATSDKPRFEWNKIKTADSQNTSSDSTSELVLTTFDSSELYQTDLESSDEEEDDALAVPAFYKYQRRQKLNAGFKFIQIESTTSSQQSKATTTSAKSTSTTSSKPTAFSKLKQQTSARKPVVHKPKAVKSKATKDAKQQNLIITYSENRKDTLRSACTTTKSIIKSKPSESAFKPAVANESMKQQSLLDMLKQRKRKTTNVAVCHAHSNAQSTKQAANSDHLAQNLIGAAGSIAHNLRPRTMSSN